MFLRSKPCANISVSKQRVEIEETNEQKSWLAKAHSQHFVFPAKYILGGDPPPNPEVAPNPTLKEGNFKQISTCLFNDNYSVLLNMCHWVSWISILVGRSNDDIILIDNIFHLSPIRRKPT